MLPRVSGGTKVAKVGQLAPGAGVAQSVMKPNSVTNVVSTLIGQLGKEFRQFKSSPQGVGGKRPVMSQQQIQSIVGSRVGGNIPEYSSGSFLSGAGAVRLPSGRAYYPNQTVGTTGTFLSGDGKARLPDGTAYTPPEAGVRGLHRKMFGGYGNAGTYQAPPQQENIFTDVYGPQAAAQSKKKRGGGGGYGGGYGTGYDYGSPYAGGYEYPYQSSWAGNPVSNVLNWRVATG